MSAAPRHPRDLGYAGLRMTADEYLSLGETQDRYELVDGVVFMSPSPLPRHGEVLSELVYQLKAFAGGTRAIRVFPETDVQLSAQTVYRPDVAVYRADRLPAAPERLDSAPDLIIEILSPTTRPFDLITKRDDYERFGVAEYWVVDPTNGAVRRFLRRSQRLVETPADGDSLLSEAIAGFTLDLRPLRA